MSRRGGRRWPLSSALTGRGRGLLAAGAVLLAAGMLLGERPLVQAAVFVLALPLVSALLVAGGGWSVTTTRSVTPDRVPRGQEADVLLQLANESRRRGGTWLVADQLPEELGASPRFVVEGLAAGERSTLRYRVAAARRGRHTLGPLRLRQVDPFGLVSRVRAGSDATSLVVVPRVHELGAARLPGGHGSGGSGARRSLAVQGEDDVSAREYRRGDDLRKVHWRATARTGELMVRLEERPERSSATLLLDTRSCAHLVAPADPTDSLEWLVETAASIGTALVRRGCPVRLLTETGSSGRAEPAVLRPHELLDRLAVLTASSLTGLGRGVEQLRHAAAPGALICLLGAVGPDDVAELTRAPVGIAGAYAVLVDPTGWAAGRDAGRGLLRRTGRRSAAGRELSEQCAEAAELLRGAGWRVALAGQGSSVAEVWQELVSTGQEPRLTVELLA